MRSLLSVLVLALATTVFAEIRKFDLPTLQKLGVAIYEQDARAADATDVLFATKFDPAKEGLRGWVVEGGKSDPVVRFIREREGKLEAFADVRFHDAEKPKLEHPSDVTLSESQLAQFRARQLAAQNIRRRCSDRYNLVILPDPEKDGLLVYALAATDEPNVILVGGHYRFTISKDGKTIERADELFASCLKINNPSSAIPKGATPVAPYMTTLVSDTPLETHVFLSLLHHVPFYVGTPDRQTWQVSKGVIAKAEKPAL